MKAGFVRIAVSFGVALGTIALRPPDIVVGELPRLVEIKSVADLPSGIRAGRFTGENGSQPSNWALADRGAPFNSGDANPNPRLPSRQLVLAACDESLCILHYRRGGSGEVDCILALAPIHDWKSVLPWEPSWKVVWFATGHPPLRDFAALRSVVLGTNGAYGYETTQSAGTLF